MPENTKRSPDQTPDQPSASSLEAPASGGLVERRDQPMPENLPDVEQATMAGARPAPANQNDQREAATRFLQDYVADNEAHRVVQPSGPQAVKLGVTAPSLDAPAVAVAPMITAAQVPPPSGYYSAFGASGTIHEPATDFLASTHGYNARPVTVDRTTVAADANGDRILVEGTVMAAVPASSPVKYRPRTGAQVAAGICTQRVNLRDADQDIAMMISGSAQRRHLIDDGVLGAPAAASTPETELRNMGLYIRDYEP